MKILIPTAKEMNTSLPLIEALPLSEESQAVLDSLAHYSASELETFAGFEQCQCDGSGSQHGGFF